MKKLTRICCCMLALTATEPTTVVAQSLESRVLPAAGGAVLGAAGGGYITVSIIVLESRFRRYVHDIDDVLNWRSAPIVVGAVTGMTLGAYSPRHLESAVLYGAAGMLAGGVVGWGAGSLIWEPPEGRWAGATIGAGLGLIAGNVLGVLNPVRGSDRPRPSNAGIPVVIRIPL
jgi:hypothetical protein